MYVVFQRTFAPWMATTYSEMYEAAEVEERLNKTV